MSLTLDYELLIMQEKFTLDEVQFNISNIKHKEK
jgi:hypothetical protein